ncbi:alpha/beta fold hydrolase [Pararhizobium haloflavum]|uniref:alpha/beta fold hydrolase n=1 Tax=Pararhizobium haloflavum TaxID=2037914 RepID=UPI000C185051|nr:alpha/beta hydrolase [Pararhizobium haloflavum]
MTETFSASSFAAPDGAVLNVHHAPPAGDCRAVIQICHGLAEHAGRYGKFSERMAKEGYAVFAHDHRGHGETRAPGAPLGQFAKSGGLEKVVSDVLFVRQLAADRHPGLPVILFGHSMGGLIALNTAISRPDAYAALAIWNANFKAGIAGRAAQAILAVERAFKGSDVPSTIIPRLTFEAWGNAVNNHRTMFDWLSHDPAVVDAYIADPRCGFDASVSMWRDVFALVYRGGDPANWQALPKALPIHLRGGGEDPGTDYGKAVAWLATRLRKAGFTDVSLTIEPAMRHETLNEVGAERAIADFATWLDQAVPGQTSRGNRA